MKTVCFSEALYIRYYNCIKFVEQMRFKVEFFAEKQKILIDKRHSTDYDVVTPFVWALDNLHSSATERKVKTRFSTHSR